MEKWKYGLTSTLDEGEWSASMPWPFFPRYVLDRRLGRPQSQSGRCGEEKNFLPLFGIKLLPSVWWTPPWAGISSSEALYHHGTEKRGDADPQYPEHGRTLNNLASYFSTVK
jgi:hypothetical protein